MSLIFNLRAISQAGRRGFESIGIFLGRGLILPIVNVTSSCFTLVFLLICAGVVKTRLRRTSASPQPAYRVPGGIVTACLGCSAGVDDSADLDGARRAVLVCRASHPFEYQRRGTARINPW